MGYCGKCYVVMNKKADFQKGQGFRVEISDKGVRLKKNAPWGTYTTCVWDSKEKQMDWHRLRVRLSKGSRSSFTASVYTSDSPYLMAGGNCVMRLEELLSLALPPKERERWMAPYLAAQIENPRDALLLGVQGRYLWIVFRFLPWEEEQALTELRVEFPRRSWAAYLPEIYRREQGKDRFTERYLAVFQRLSEELTEQIEAVPSRMEPASASFSDLKWMAGLFAVEDPELWEEGQLRYLLSNVMRLYQIRGTGGYLKELIGLYRGTVSYLVEYHQAEPFEQRLSDGRRIRELYCAHPYEFALLLPEQEAGKEKEEGMLRRIVDLAKPAWMECRIVVLKPYIFLDQYSYLGINSVLGRYQPARLNGLCAVPFSTVGAALEGRQKERSME